MSEPTKLTEVTERLADGTRVRLKVGGHYGTITGYSAPWYHISFDDDFRPFVCNYYGDHEFYVL